MRREFLDYLVCPSCKHTLMLCPGYVMNGGSIADGTLRCVSCTKTYDIIRHVPRFVPLENYASGFGFQWTRHAKTQCDRFSGTSISETRFFSETRWPRDMRTDIILEAGCGSGRFTEQVLGTGATVVAMDYSCAVDASHALNGDNPKLLLVQADIYHFPFKEAFFDKVFCLGVLQHTPDVERAFFALPPVLRAGGSLTIDVYLKRGGLKGLFETKYWVRPLTRTIPPEKLYRWCKRYITAMWPVARLISRIPYLGRRINWKLLIADRRGEFDLTEEQLQEWAILDTFDMLAHAYDFPQTLQMVQEWFVKAGLQHIDVCYGYNGIEGRGIKAKAQQTE